MRTECTEEASWYGKESDPGRLKSKEKEKRSRENSQKIYNSSALIYFFGILKFPCTAESEKHTDDKYHDVYPCDVVPQDT